MISSSVSNLFGNPANPTSAKTAQPPAASPFGEMLSREIGSRQNANSNSSAQENSSGNDSGTKTGAPTAQSKANNADSLNARGRQDRQRLQDNRDAQAAATEKATDLAKAKVAADAKAIVAGNEADTGTGSSASATKDTDTDTDAAAATLAGTDATSITPASAELLALVHSLLPKGAAAAPATATAGSDAGVDAQSQPGSNVAARLTMARDAIATTDATANDPAFDALLAQAAQAVQGAKARETGLDIKASAQKTADTTMADDVATRAAAQLAPDTAATAATTTLAASANAARNNAALTATAASVANAAAVPGTIAAAAALSEAPVPTVLPPGTSLATATPANVAGAAQATGLPFAGNLAPHVGTTAWDHALGQRVVWMAAGAQQSASLTLNPPDLGPLQVVINVSNAQADASFTAAQPEVRQALEAAMPRLREMLADAGITLGQSSVSAGTPDQSNASGGQQAQAGSQRSSTGEQRDSSNLLPASGARRQISTGGNGLVDTFA